MVHISLKGGKVAHFVCIGMHFLDVSIENTPGEMPCG